MPPLLGLIRPTSGAARLFGLDSVTDSLEIRRRVGFLPGDLALYRKLTGRRERELGGQRLPDRRLSAQAHTALAPQGQVPRAG
jgi:ABC-2 type transport system ATP-binding protein